MQTLNFKLFKNNTKIVIPTQCIKNLSSFNHKLETIGIVEIDPYEREDISIKEIELKDNPDLSQEVWDEFYEILTTEVTNFNIIFSK